MTQCPRDVELSLMDEVKFFSCNFKNKLQIKMIRNGLRRYRKERHQREGENRMYILIGILFLLGGWEIQSPVDCSCGGACPQS